MTPPVRQCVTVRRQCVNALSSPVRQCVSAYIDALHRRTHCTNSGGFSASRREALK